MNYSGNKVEDCLNTKSYCGYLDQNEFLTRYYFIKNRISNSFTREEMAFLLGRTPYFMIDYEELSGNTKLSISDSDFLCQILKRVNHEAMRLDKTCGKIVIAHEKRMVRITQREYNQRIVYEFIHPWTTDGVCQPLKVVEPKYDTLEIEKAANERIINEIKSLIESGYFNNKKTPIEIYERIWKTFKFESTAWSVIFLKGCIYSFIRENILTSELSKGHFTYQLKSSRLV